MGFHWRIKSVKIREFSSPLEQTEDDIKKLKIAHPHVGHVDFHFKSDHFANERADQNITLLL